MKAIYDGIHRIYVDSKHGCKAAQIAGSFCIVAFIGLVGTMGYVVTL